MIKIKLYQIVIFVALGLLILFGISRVSLLSSPQKPHYTPAPLPTSNAGKLMFVTTSGDNQAIRQVDVSASGAISGTAESALDSDLPSVCEVGGQTASSDGRKIALKVYCDDSTYTQVLDIETGQVQLIEPDPGQQGYFLGWAPGENAILLSTEVLGEDQIVLLDLETGETERIDTLPDTYNASISPDNERILFVLTKGLGLGGELWMMDRDGRNKRQLLREPQHIIAYSRWSPAGDRVAYIRMADSNIPFTIGELCLADWNGSNQRCISNEEAATDAGHGYPPAWSPDGKWVAFVVRANPHDAAADNDPAALISNIYLADPATDQVHPLTNFEQAIVDSAVWAPNGLQLAFRVTENGSSDLWLADLTTSKIEQLTYGNPAGYPVWLSEERNEK